MIREWLEEYRSKMEEIRELEYKLNHLGEGDSLVGNSTIFDYRSGYPHPQAVIGYDYEKYKRLQYTYQNRLESLKAECSEVECWIENIPDSMIRRIFRMYYIDGMTQQQISKSVHLDRSRVSRKMDYYIKTHTKHTKHIYNKN